MKFENKEEIIDALKQVYDNVLDERSKYKDITDINLQLVRLSEQFVRSFEYDLPKEYSIRGKIKRLVQKIIRKSIRFLTRPYADKMLRFQECTCQIIGDIIRKNEIDMKILHEHEIAIYKLSENLNDSIHSVMKLNDYVFHKDNDVEKSYSQAGEDIIVNFLLNYSDSKTRCRSYLDIGCNHYKKLNNTYSLYLKGIRGVLVEANPKFIDELRNNRPDDIILNVGVGDVTGDKIPFYIMNGDGLSSFSLETVQKVMSEAKWLEIVETIDVPVMTFNDIIEKYYDEVPTVVSIDIEGEELKVLRSIDMESYRPYLYIIETVEYKTKIVSGNKRIDIIDFMENNDYYEYAFTGVNSIFVDKRALK